MKKIIYPLVLLFICHLSLQAQDMPPAKTPKMKFGIKAGYTWSYATADQSGVTLNSKSGYMAGIFIEPPRRGIIGYKTELVYSRQGYNYDDGGKNTDILNDYIYLPQLTTFNIGKFFQLQLGAQVGFVLNAKKTTSTQDSSIIDLMNRVDYGFAGGVELNPISGLILGARYNLGLGKMYKQYQPSMSNPMPYPLPFNPQTTNLKNGMIHVYVGFKF